MQTTVEKPDHNNACGFLRFFLWFVVLVPLVLCACSDEKKEIKDHFSGQNIMDLPEVTQVLYHPLKTPRGPVPAGAVNIDIQVADGITLGCRLFTHAPTAPTLVFFHGNAETVADYDQIGPYYTGEGMNFVVTDYRGYGWSDGVPLTSTFLPDSNAVFLGLKQWLTANGYTGALFVMGRSLGSASAIEVAVSHSEAISGLIIESGFAKTLPLAKALGLDLAALGISEEQTFNNSHKIGKFTKPTLILHGQRDHLIPLWQAEQLMADCGAKGKELQVVPGADHNTLIAVAGGLYFQTIRKFVEQAAGIAPDWRERRKQFKAREQASE